MQPIEIKPNVTGSAESTGISAIFMAMLHPVDQPTTPT